MASVLWGIDLLRGVLGPEKQVGESDTTMAEPTRRPVDPTMGPSESGLIPTSIGYGASLGGHGVLKGYERSQAMIQIPAQDGDNLIITVDIDTGDDFYLNDREASVFAWSEANDGDQQRYRALIVGRSRRELHFRVSGDMGAVLQIKNDSFYDFMYNWFVQGITEP